MVGVVVVDMGCVSRHGSGGRHGCVGRHGHEKYVMAVVVAMEVEVGRAMRVEALGLAVSSRGHGGRHEHEMCWLSWLCWSPWL